ncbi:unnamed protein product [Cunninghamella blakesleeana]
MDRKSRTSRSATLENSNEELNLWKQICNSLIELEHIQKKTETTVKNLNDIRNTISTEEGMSTSIYQRLKECYRGGIDLSSNEVKTITDIIEKLTVLTALREASEIRDQKRKKRKSEVEELKSASSSPLPKKTKSNGILLPGTSVAARQPKQKEKNEEWILAVVLNFHQDKNKYQVEDVEQDEYGQKQKYTLQPRNVIPIPTTSDLEYLPEINVGEDVLALYPGTTCFYSATIVQTPSKEANQPKSYKIKFEDDNNEIKSVKQEYVLQIPKGKS